MNLAALQHLARAAQVLADDRQIVVIGSASLLASFPELGADGGLLATTFDGDLCFRPFDEATGNILNEALCEAGAFHLRYGYYADIVRPEILDILPAGWDVRLRPVPGLENAVALDPHDLAIAKLFAGRPKDLNLIRALLATGRLEAQRVTERLRCMKWMTGCGH